MHASHKGAPHRRLLHRSRLVVLRLLLLPAPLLGQAAPADPAAAPTDWPAIVAKAHESPRLMLRRAAARKVVGGGDAAVEAIRAYAAQHGRDALGLEFVAAFQDAREAGPATIGLLREWALAREFYWRSQALGALAQQRLEALRPLFRAHLADPAHVVRIEAACGLCRLDSGGGADGGERDSDDEKEGDRDRAAVLALLRDPDPRVRTRVAICLVEEKDDRGLPTLVESLRQDGAFHDYPWGRLAALDAFKCLAAVADADYGFLPGGTVAENAAAIERFAAFSRERLGERWQAPVPAYREAAAGGAEVDPAGEGGGIEIRSCRNGDLFVRWSEGGKLVFGLTATDAVQLAPESWKALRASHPPAGREIRGGKVVCDYLRVMCKNPATDLKVAPGGLDRGTTSWLTGMAAAIAAAGRKDLSHELESRLEQFLPARNQ